MVGGGFIVGIRISVKVLLSRLCRDRDGRREEHGVGVVGVQDWNFDEGAVPGLKIKRYILY